MALLSDLFDLGLLDDMLHAGNVRLQTHPTLPLAILNYTQRAAYDRVWNPVTMQCRGLIVEQLDPESDDATVVARPFPKFFNYGEDMEPVEMGARAVVTDKIDGSLGILFPTSGSSYAVATRGSFTSEQALHATDIWTAKYESWGWRPKPGVTYLFEIVYPENRVVLDYGDMNDLVLLGALNTETGLPVHVGTWPGPRAEVHSYKTFGEALAAEPRLNAEGYVVYFPDLDVRLKLKQDDYVALHRILTGLNARNIWEVAAVQACAPLIERPTHWASYLGIDPARAEEVLALGDDWLEGVPDEFYNWVDDVILDARTAATQAYRFAQVCAARASEISDRRERYEHVQRATLAESLDETLATHVMRLANEWAGYDASVWESLGRKQRDRLLMACWRVACPEPTAPFARDEAIA